MSNPVTLTDLVNDAAFLGLEHQIHLEELVGDADWYVRTADEPVFEFTGSHELRCESFQFVGTAAPGPNSWLWGWANESCPPELTELSATVREYGRQHGIAELVNPEIPFDALPGSPTEPTLVGAMLGDAAKVVTGHWTSYIPNVGRGTRGVYLLEHKDFVLPEPQLPRVMRVIEQGISTLRLMTDHRRALWSYALRRGLGASLNAEHTALELVGPGFRIVAEFDDHGRATEISATNSVAAR